MTAGRQSGAQAGDLPGMVEAVPGVELDRLVDRHAAPVGMHESAIELYLREGVEEDRPAAVQGVQ